ncbi:hypothetical protein M3484_18880 [Pseudomonas sp. GX19020]|uniref:hypothetical protein n=1 Tax=Pseudomonas sp. GX19020 TaxID=2942277 RepID=UPI0020188976|nr:hypothetical protein [Pseudomonas sp. GX19020]MCL4068633.1 hypothetical protein [Pseudomonas sp. GX19020]
MRKQERKHLAKEDGGPELMPEAREELRFTEEGYRVCLEHVQAFADDCKIDCCNMAPGKPNQDMPSSRASVTICVLSYLNETPFPFLDPGPRAKLCKSPRCPTRTETGRFKPGVLLAPDKSRGKVS